MTIELICAPNWQYHDRASKARYVWEKYQSLLAGKKILDVGADECHLKNFIDPDSEYWGIGLGGTPDQEVDLEIAKIPFPDDSYDCVLCLDVMEHIENLHDVFDDLCRVTRQYVIISLPNAWSSFAYSLLTRSSLKYYGLPVEAPSDRHKWFFSASEIKYFISQRAAMNNMQLVHMDSELIVNKETPLAARLGHQVGLWFIGLFGLKKEDFSAGTVWAVLEKKQSE